MTTELHLTQGKVVLFDDADFEMVSGYKWHAQKNKHTFYALTRVRNPDGKQPTQLMHRLILGLTDPKILCDHINGDGLDNRRENLRICSNAENMRNSRKYITNTSGFKGVTWDKKNGKWKAQIWVNYKYIYLGLHQSPEEAHATYCQAAIKYHKQFASIAP